MQTDMNKSPESIPEALEGKRIKEVFKNAQRIAELHNTLASKRGDYFRKKLLHMLGDTQDPGLFGRLRDEAGVREYQRHIHKLIRFKLIEASPQAQGESFIRTPLGEEAVNALRELERNVGREAAKRIYEASLGMYSIQLSLRVYGSPKEADFVSRKVKYTPLEVGQLTYFLPRSMDGLASIDKLNEAGLLVYEDDEHVYAPAILLRSFYKYLLALHEILQKSG